MTPAIRTLPWLLLLIPLSIGTAWWLASLGSAVPELDPNAMPAIASQEPVASTLARSAPATPSDQSPVAANMASMVSAPDALLAECLRILQMPSPAQRQLAFVQLLASVQDENGLRLLLDAFETLRKQGKRNGAEWSAFWSEMVARDPALAVRLYQTSERGRDWQASVASLLAFEWAARDPGAAITWLASDTRLEAKALDAATLSLLSGYALRDSHAATNYALKVIAQNDPLFGDMAFILSSAALQSGGKEGLFAWFDALPDEALKHRLFPSVSNRLERLSLEERAAWLSSQSTNTWRNDLAYRDFAGAWAEQDPQAALEWVFTLPPSPRDGGITGLGYAVFPWLEKDFNGFTSYFHSLPENRRQEIVRTLRQITSDPKFPDRKRQPGLAFLNSVQ